MSMNVHSWKWHIDKATVQILLIHELSIILNLEYHLFIYDYFTAKFQFIMHIHEQLYEIDLKM